MRRFPEKPHKKLWLLGLVPLVIIGVIIFKTQKSHAPGSQASQQITTAPKAEKLTVTGKYLFHGTIFWGRGVEHWAQKPDGSYDYGRPFSALNTFEPEKYDAWIADLECPVSDHHVSFYDQVNNLVFNCRPEFLAEAAKYFQVVSLANNHSLDRGTEAFAQTRTNLDKNGVQYFGNYDPSVAEDICEVIALPVKVKKGEIVEKGTLPVAMCAWHYFMRGPEAGELEVMKDYAAHMPVFAFVHMGVEYLPEATEKQRAIAHQVADLGPVFIIANNPHWVQDSEIYEDTLIVYSTGNFIFDQLDYETQRSASIEATITAEGEDLDKWLTIGESCKAFHDSCLVKIKEQKLTPWTTKPAYTVVAGDGRNRLTKKADPALQQAVEERLKWPETKRLLEQ
jgi:hypothetical protein